MNNRFINYYMDIADRTALLSRAVRLKVGAVLVKDGRIISQSWNGTLAGQDNNCEFKEWMPEGCLHLDHEYPYEEYSDYGLPTVIGRYRLKTKPEVIHAEANLLGKIMRCNESSNGATIFITHAPCIDCAKLISLSGIVEVYYKHTYRNNAGVEFLEQLGVNINQYGVENEYI